MDRILTKLHPHNLKQLKGHIKAFGPTWIHGDGNIYKEKDEKDPKSTDHSLNNATFSNPDREEASYRKLYGTIGEVPSSVEALEKELVEARFKDAAARRNQSKTQSNTTFDAFDEDDAPKGKGKGGKGKGSGTDGADDKAGTDGADDKA